MPDRIYTYAPLWGVWQIESLIGEGSFGKVYKAFREEFGTRYAAAVKCISIPASDTEVMALRSEGMDDASVRSYFMGCAQDVVKEINAMMSFRGLSNIVTIEDFIVADRQDGPGFDILIRMELLESLSARMLKREPDRKETITLGVHICRALALCHRQNTIHRDIKPDNIFLSPHGEYKLGDFGIARQIERTMSGLSKKGTYTYMAPEVYRGDPYTPSVDIYSLGIVLYRLLNGNRTPFLPPYPQAITARDREEALLRRVRGDAIPAPEHADAKLAAAVQRAVAFDPAARYASAREMGAALEECLREEQKRGEDVALALNDTPAEPPHDTTTPPAQSPEEHGAGDPCGESISSVAPAQATFRTGHAASVADDKTDILPAPHAAPAMEETQQKPPTKEITAILRNRKVWIATAAVAVAAACLVFVFRRSNNESWETSAAESTQTSINAQIPMQQPAATPKPSVATIDAGTVDKSRVLQALAKPEAELAEEDKAFLASLGGELELNACSLTDISALQYATELTGLLLRDNQISDIEALRGLINLKELDLWKNEVSDVEPLRGLAGLTSLSMSFNQVSSIEPLGELPNLMTLSLGTNPIKDFNVLRGLTTLKSLTLAGTQLSDLEPLRGLTNLVALFVGDNQISDIEPISGLTNLVSVNLGDNQISDIEPLRGLANLTIISLENNQISDVEPLRGLTNLTNLYLGGNQISNIEPLRNLTDLTWLTLRDNPLSEIETIKNFAKLEELYLHDTPFGKAELRALQESLPNCKIAY